MLFASLLQKKFENAFLISWLQERYINILKAQTSIAKTDIKSVKLSYNCNNFMHVKNFYL